MGIAELDAVVGEHGVDAVGDGLDRRLEEARCALDVRGLVQLCQGELGCSVDGHERMALALFGPDLGDVDVEEADGVVFDGPLGRVAFDLW